jgi:hypothetical protein
MNATRLDAVRGRHLLMHESPLLGGATRLRPVRFAVVASIRHHNAPHSRTAACLRARFSKCPRCQRTRGCDANNTRQYGKRPCVHGQPTPSAVRPTAQSRRHLPGTRTVGGGERPCSRALCPRDLAGKSLRCAGYQPEGSRKHRPIHACDCQLAPASTK